MVDVNDLSVLRNFSEKAEENSQKLLRNPKQMENDDIGMFWETANLLLFNTLNITDYILASGVLLRDVKNKSKFCNWPYLSPCCMETFLILHYL